MHSAKCLGKNVCNLVGALEEQDRMLPSNGVHGNNSAAPTKPVGFSLYAHNIEYMQQSQH